MLPSSLYNWSFKPALTQADTQGTAKVKVEPEANEILLTFSTLIVKEGGKSPRVSIRCAEGNKHTPGEHMIIYFSFGALWIDVCSSFHIHHAVNSQF